jgi:ubiquinone/menaquinone biosynthesis C-methylase UbiE
MFMTKKILTPSIVLVLSLALFFLLMPESSFSQRGRENWQPPEEIMDVVGVIPGMKIGEAGAGTGYFTFPLAKRVGPTGKIYANDINEDSLGRLRRRAQAEGLDNIEIVIGETTDPLFPEKQLDMIIMVYVMHHLAKPVEFLKNLKPYLKPGAPLVIIEQDGDRDRTHSSDFMSPEQALKTIKQSPFSQIRIETFLSRDTIYICTIK